MEAKIVLLMAALLTFLILWMLFIGVTMAYPPPFTSQFAHLVLKDRLNENVVVSPAGVRAALASAYIGSEGTTSAELKIALKLKGAGKKQVAQSFSDIIALSAGKTAPLQMANRIYVQQMYNISSEFNATINKYLASAVASFSATELTKTAYEINKWIEMQTAGEINEIVNATRLNDGRTAFIVSATHLGVEWERNFDRRATQYTSFYTNRTHGQIVEMMFQVDRFFIGTFNELWAKGLYLPCKDSNMTMLILLPYALDGLEYLEENIKSMDFHHFGYRMRQHRVRLQLPKFRIHFNISLQPILEQLGIKTMFTRHADLSDMVLASDGLKMSEVEHAASLEVNELGTIPTEVRAVKIFSEPLEHDEITYDFSADHPFFFAIQDHKNVYLTGHVVNF